MAIEYHINERDELVTLTAKGPVTGPEARGCIEELLNDTAFDPALPQLIDLRTAEPTGASADMADFEAFLLADFRPRLASSVAIVVNPDWNEEQCAKAFWVSCALGTAELFDGWNQACKWLIASEFDVEGHDFSEMADLGAICADTGEPDPGLVDNPDVPANADTVKPPG